MRAILPRDNDVLTAGRASEFSWTEVPNARTYELEVQGRDGSSVLGAVVLANATRYRAPSWLAERADGALRWRVVAKDVAGGTIQRTAWRTLRVGDVTADSSRLLPK
jgi:hypothetical protein